MPFKSQAQRRKFAQLLVEGKISADTFEEWNRETGARKLPERARVKGTKQTRTTKNTKKTKDTKTKSTKTKGTKKITKGARKQSR
jgi:hypothetical protein